MHFLHVPVLLDEVLKNLNISPGNKYIDATLGGGGHTKAILERGGLVLGIDQDQEAIEFVKENLKFKIQNSKLKLVRGNFKNIKDIAVENGFTGVSGILFDLGVSSYQMDSDTRGFSIKSNGPLDMRMDLDADITAKDIINSYSQEDLVDIFQRFGEEERAQEAAKQIVSVRKNKDIETTGELVSVLGLILKKQGIVHPATKIFQALRIEVNKEIDALKVGLEQVVELLTKGARVEVISFHSLEDRIVKHTFDNWEKQSLGKPVNRKPITANHDEVRSNPRARSAKLRVFERN